jgi:hypothetical protein
VLFALNLLEGSAFRLATKVFLDGFQVCLSRLLLWVVAILRSIDHLKVLKVLYLKVLGLGFWVSPGGKSVELHNIIEYNNTGLVQRGRTHTVIQ